MLLSAPQKESQGVPDDQKENTRIYCPSTRRTQIDAHSSVGVLITTKLPSRTIAQVSPARLLSRCIYRCCFSPVARAGH